MDEITELYAVIAQNPDEEGICSFEIDNVHYPMVANSKGTLKKFKRMAQEISDLYNKPLKIAKFTVREDIEEIVPQKESQNG